MYAVVQIGSKFLRSAWGTKRRVPPRFWACTAGADRVTAAAAAVPRKARRLRSLITFSCGRLLKKAHLLRWRPRPHAQRTERTPRVRPSGAASHLDLLEQPASFSAFCYSGG